LHFKIETAPDFMPVVIQVENVSKYYRLGLIGGGTLHEDLNRWWARVRGRPDPLLKIGATDHGNRVGGELWALRDVSFQVREGEVLGIIGRNGAGKSTLLKILSKITAPTSGVVRLRGRVGSLLEVGTGFHGELTGRENVFLNGTILGMSRREVTAKLDEIVDFAGISEFIDTPVKRYSSGMTVRLAFAVAAHLEPEILIVDEVLAVGDAGFQTKCLGKLKDVTAEGRTVLFVSHNMGAIQSLCTRGMLLRRGGVDFIGTTEETIAHYLAQQEERHCQALTTRTQRHGNGWLRFRDVTLHDSQGSPVNSLKSGHDGGLRVRFELEPGRTPRHVTFSIGIDNAFGQRITLLGSELLGLTFDALPEGAGHFDVEIERLPLRPGHYVLTLFAAAAGQIMDWVIDAVDLDVDHGDFYGSGKSLPDGQGLFLMRHAIHCG